MNRKPDFFIVGAPRSGTTSLYNYLTQHPDIFMPVRKEPYFFGGWRETSGEDLRAYLQLFSGVSEDKAAGEASTTYFYLESAAEEIKAFQPDAKIIIVLRNPVDRAYSQYWHHRRLGWVNSSFEEELEIEEKRLREGWRGFRPSLVPPAYYVETGHYSKHVERYIETFGRERIRVYLFEDLSRDPDGVCLDIVEFLGVDPGYQISARQVYNTGGPLRSSLFYEALSLNLRLKEPIKQVLPASILKMIRAVKEWILRKNTKTVPEMNPKTQAHLQQVFRDDVLYVEELAGRNLSHWLGSPA